MPYELNTELLNKYRIEALIGAGAFGEVYRALHLQLKAPRALKVLRRDAPGVGSSDFQRCRERFELEAQLGAQLEGHAHIIQVYDFEQDAETLILVMEYAPGGSLAERLEAARRERRPLPVAEALRWMTEIAEGLAALHALDAVHRDLKPSNVLFDAQGRAKLADFGLAQLPGGPSMRAQLSRPEPHPGTPAYMSPEQRETTDHLTPAADSYALGCVLFETLTGRVYRSQRPGARPQTLRAEVPAWLDAAVMRCLEKDIEARPWDGAELLDLLRGGEAEEAARKQREAEEAARQAAVRKQREAEEAARKQREAEAEVRRQREAEAAVRKQREAEESARRQREAEAAVRKQREVEEAARKQREVEAVARRGIVTGNQLTLRLVPGVELTFVRIPVGEFLMGSDPKVDKDAHRDEQPQRKVYLDGYWMGQTLVTNAHYAAFVNATGRKAPSHWQSGKIPGGKEQHPVVYVSWEDATVFCAWASQVTGREVRLPSEAEWEKAARGVDGHVYPWGNKPPDAMRCNFGNNVIDTTSVGRYSPRGNSPYACMDMAGNVWEWCADWFDADYYKTTPARNPLGPQKGAYRVLRGGSWSSNVQNVRSAFRNRDTSSDIYVKVGFRCVVSFLPGE